MIVCSCVSLLACGRDRPEVSGAQKGKAAASETKARKGRGRTSMTPAPVRLALLHMQSMLAAMLF